MAFGGGPLADPRNPVCSTSRRPTNGASPDAPRSEASGMSGRQTHQRQPRSNQAHVAVSRTPSSRSRDRSGRSPEIRFLLGAYRGSSGHGPRRRRRERKRRCRRCCRCASGRRDSGKAILFGVRLRRPPEGFHRNNSPFLSWKFLCVIDGYARRAECTPVGKIRGRIALGPSRCSCKVLVLLSLPSASFRLPPGSELVQLNVDTHAQCV
jgi:hypothetical protein